MRGVPRQRSDRGIESGGLLRSSALSMAGAGAAALLNFLFVVLLAREADQIATGLFFTLTSAFVLAVSVFRMGAPTGLVYFLSRFVALQRTDLLPRVLAVALRPVLAVSITGPLVILGLATAGWGDSVTVPRQAVVALALLAPSAVLMDVFLSATRALGSVKPLVVVDRVLRPLGQLVLLGLLVLSERDTVDLVVAAWALPYLPSMLVALVLMRRRVAAHVARAEPEVGGDPEPVGREFWWYSAPQGLNAVLKAVLQRADILLLAALVGPAPAAIYGAVSRFLVLGQLGGMAISTVVQSHFSALHALGDRRRLSDFYQLSTAWLVLATWPVYLFLAVYASQVSRVFGEDYVRGAPVVWVLAAGMLVATGSGVVDSVLLMSGRSRLLLVNSAVATGLNIVLNLVLIPPLGITGAAIAWACAIVVNNVLPLIEVRRTLRIHPLGPAAMLSMATATFCFGVLPLVARLALGEGGMVPVLGVSVSVYAALLLVLRERLHLTELLPRAAFRRRGRSPAQR